MKLLNKKISLGYVLAALFLTGTLVYSLGYKMAMDKFNNLVSNIYEKQKTYSILSEIDYNIRENCICDLQDDKVLSEISRGYISGIDDQVCNFFTKDEYKNYLESLNNDSGVDFTKLENGILYMKCNSIPKNSAEIIKNNIDSAVSEGSNSLIIDLRNCKNSDDEEVFKIIKNIMPAGDIISAVDKSGNSEVVCTSEGTNLNLKISVLVNENTSGSCELIASSLRNRENTKIVGAKTLGNTVRLKTVTLSDDSVIIFPDAYYITMDGENLFKKGIIPDVEISLDKNQEESFLSGSLKLEDDLQLQSAIKVLE